MPWRGGQVVYIKRWRIREEKTFPSPLKSIHQSLPEEIHIYRHHEGLQHHRRRYPRPDLLSLRPDCLLLSRCCRPKLWCSLHRLRCLCRRLRQHQLPLPLLQLFRHPSLCTGLRNQQLRPYNRYPSTGLC